MSTKQRIFIPTYISSVDYQPARVQPRLLFYNGLKDCEPYYVASGSAALATNQALNAFPYFDNYSGQNTTTSSLSLLFFNEEAPYGVPPTASLYTEYWEDYVELLYNPRTRLLNASAIIPLADYFKMELNDIVDFRGNYYHLRAINDYSLTNGECKIQLLGPILREAIAIQDDCSFGYTLSVVNCEFNFTSSIITTTTTTISPITTTTTTIPGQRQAIPLAFKTTGEGGNQQLASACSNAQLGIGLTTYYIEPLLPTYPMELGTQIFTGLTGSQTITPVYTYFSDGQYGYVVDPNGEITLIRACNVTTTTLPPTPPPAPQAVQNFLTASGITDNTISNALTTLVNGMESAGIWQKMYAVYPFVGGTQNSNRWNLKDTTVYNLSQVGNWNYSSNGVSSSKAPNSGLDTNLAITDLMANDISFGIYSRTNGQNGYDMGAQSSVSPGNQMALIAQYSDNRFYWAIPTQIGGVSTAVTSSLGFFQASRTANNRLVGYNNQYQAGINVNVPVSRNYFPMYIGNVNDPLDVPPSYDDAPSNRQYAFSYIGKGLTDSQLVTYNTLVQQFQTSLGRQV